MKHAAGPSVASPDGQHTISNVFCSNRKDERALVLRNVKSGTRGALYAYMRDATVLWSPDSGKIAINDYAGSDFTNNLVLSVDQKAPPINLKNQLLQSS